MGVFKVFSGSIKGTLSTQWREIITAKQFGFYDIVVPAVVKHAGARNSYSQFEEEGIITNGSMIYVPENTVAVIFDKQAIEEYIYESGGYVYQDGVESIFDEGLSKKYVKSFANQFKSRFTYAGMSTVNKKIIFVNLREIQSIKFGTHGPLLYHDLFYGLDLEVIAHGQFNIKIENVERFIQRFLPAGCDSLSMEDWNSKNQIVLELLQSFSVALTGLSDRYRISQLVSKSYDIINEVENDRSHVGSWNDRYGFRLTNISIENIQFSENSRNVVNTYNSNQINFKSYENVSNRVSDAMAKQKIAEGIRDHGFGEGTIMGMQIAGSILDNKNDSASINEQIELVKKLKELLDAGILTKEEFEAKKKEIMNL